MLVRFPPLREELLHTAEDGKDFGIRFRGATNSAIIDGVQINLGFKVLPEPSTIGFLGVGLLMILVGRNARLSRIDD